MKMASYFQCSGFRSFILSIFCKYLIMKGESSLASLRQGDVRVKAQNAVWNRFSLDWLVRRREYWWFFRGPGFLAVVSRIFSTTHGLLGCYLQTVSGISGISHPGSMLHVAGYSNVAVPTDFGRPTTYDISAAGIPDLNGVPFLHALAGFITRYFFKCPCF